MTNLSRRYYERELGAGYGPSPTLREAFGYSEPLRRFIQRESFEPQANEIPNTMPSWLPGNDYMTDFKVGDPYVKVDDGYARLPGAGYEAIHPELEGIAPEDYPDIHKLRILSDVAPYSSEYTRSFRPASHKKLRARGPAKPPTSGFARQSSQSQLTLFTHPDALDFTHSVSAMSIRSSDACRRLFSPGWVLPDRAILLCKSLCIKQMSEWMNERTVQCDGPFYAVQD